MILALAIVALVFALFAICGVIAATLVLPHLPQIDDGPQQVALPPWVPVVAATAFGCILVLRGAPVGTVGIAALATIPLCAVWYTDARTGLVPDLFTLVPLLVVVGVGALHGDWSLLVWAIAAFVPFAIAAMLSKGRGMGWGDAKFVAFGGALTGHNALLAFGVACLVATIVGAVRYRSLPTPIAFAPYLVAAVVGTIIVEAR